MNAQVRSAFRQAWRLGMRAVCYSVPARYTIRSKVRRAFRSTPSLPDAQILDNTYMFLKLAAMETKLEHKIVRNLCHVEWSMSQATRAPKAKNELDTAIQQEVYKSYNRSLAALNETHGLMLV